MRAAEARRLGAFEVRGRTGAPRVFVLVLVSCRRVRLLPFPPAAAQTRGRARGLAREAARVRSARVVCVRVRGGSYSVQLDMLHACGACTWGARPAWAASPLVACVGAQRARARAQPLAAAHSRGGATD